jgi:hypothetical protein
LSSFISSYSICSSNWCSIGFVYPFISINMWSFQYCNLASFCYSIFGVCPFHPMRKATKIFALICVNTWVVIGRHYKRNTRLEHLLWCKCNNMNHTRSFGIDFWTILFLKYSTNFIFKIFKNHDKFLNNILISITLKICQNMSFKKKLLNMSFNCLKTLIIMFY